MAVVILKITYKPSTILALSIIYRLIITQAIS